jgi:hypothetical protein
MVLTISSENDVKSKLNGKKITERVKLSGLKNVTIQDVDFSSDETDHMVAATDLQNVVFKNCKFHGKSTEGCAVNMTGTKTKDNVFDGCEWYDLSYNAGNGGEPLRLGLSKQANLFFNTVVKNCIFRNLNADVETVSIKSCGNIIEKCKHLNNKSSFVVRHGHTNTIQDNEFEGEGGIRVYGKDNKILNNKFRNNSSSKFPPISLVNGNKEDEDLSADYTQVRNAIIEGNEFDNCTKAIVWGRDSRAFKPKGVRVANNRIIADKVSTVVIEFSGGASAKDNTFEDNNILVGSKAKIDSSVKNAFKKQDPSQPDPVIVIPPPPVVEEPKPEPEEEPPVVVPTPDTDTTVHMCGIHRHAEAKNLLKIYTCAKHAEFLRPRFQKLLKEVLKEAEKVVVTQEDD